MITPDLKDLYEAAMSAKLNSHSPYSHIQVGCALKTQQGKIFSGTNVENSSYGATICAERSAILTAVTSLGKMKITEILVVTDATPPWPPCGMCRQVIAEFAEPSTRVHMTNLKGDLQSTTFSALFPNAFTPAHLNR